ELKPVHELRGASSVHARRGAACQPGNAEAAWLAPRCSNVAWQGGLCLTSRPARRDVTLTCVSDVGAPRPTASTHSADHDVMRHIRPAGAKNVPACTSQSAYTSVKQAILSSFSTDHMNACMSEEKRLPTPHPPSRNRARPLDTATHTTSADPPHFSSGSLRLGRLYP
ncbi:unnamed protein product, partial [Pleuronectes platessa]